MKSLELRIPPLVLTLLFGSIIWIIPNPYSIDGFTSTIFSLLFLSLGTIIAILGVIQFRKAKATVNPMNLDNCDKLVINGIYQYSRNPMYLGFLFLLLSLGFYLGNPISLVPSFAYVLYMNHFQIRPEEKALTEIFGKDFENYKLSVRRWI